MSNCVFLEFRLMYSDASNRCPFRKFLSLGFGKSHTARDPVSTAAAATERWCVWQKTASQDVKCVRSHCRGTGSSRHPAIFPVVFCEQIHANVARPPRIIPCQLFARRDRTRVLRYPQDKKKHQWHDFCFDSHLAPLLKSRRSRTLPLWGFVLCLPGIVTCHNVLKKLHVFTWTLKQITGVRLTLLTLFIF